MGASGQRPRSTRPGRAGRCCCGRLSNVTSARRRWPAAALLVTVGWLASPQAVPVYDGVGAPDEPYRFVTRPAGAAATAPPTSAGDQSPVASGRSTKGLSIQTAEVGAQCSLYLPPKALAASGGAVQIGAVPRAPSDQPTSGRIDGNVYLITLTDPAGPVSLTDQAALATVYLRATTARQPGPTMQFRPSASARWKTLQTSRGGQDVYVARFTGPGQYALAFATAIRSGGGGVPVLPIVLGAVCVVLGGFVPVIRLRARDS